MLRTAAHNRRRNGRPLKGTGGVRASPKAQGLGEGVRHVARTHAHEEPMRCARARGGSGARPPTRALPAVGRIARCGPSKLDASQVANVQDPTPTRPLGGSNPRGTSTCCGCLRCVCVVATPSTGRGARSRVAERRRETHPCANTGARVSRTEGRVAPLRRPCARGPTSDRRADERRSPRRQTGHTRLFPHTRPSLPPDPVPVPS